MHLPLPEQSLDIVIGNKPQFAAILLKIKKNKNT